MTHASDISVVVIGRNEGDRLLRCLASLQGRAHPVVYVDSGSTDGSVAAARALGTEVVELDMSQPFTAARARNCGYQRVRDLVPEGGYVQFIDGDCELDADWFDVALETFATDPDLAVVCGRRREKFPDASLWNSMIDAEWDSPAGEVKYCGGDALMRRAAVDAVGGYREDLIAGEEPEMCFRMREAGWRIRRIAAEMTRHDAAMDHWGQWWQRNRRAGHTYAQGVALHGGSPERYRVRELRRTVFWALFLPALILIGAAVVSPWVWLLMLAYPVQILRIRQQGKSWAESLFLLLGKFAELQGAFGYWIGGRKTLIEYKGSNA